MRRAQLVSLHLSAVEEHTEETYVAKYFLPLANIRRRERWNTHFLCYFFSSDCKGGIKEKQVTLKKTPKSKREIEARKKAQLKSSIAFKDQSALRNIRCQQSANSNFRRKSFLSKCFSLLWRENSKHATPLAKNIFAFQKVSCLWASMYLTDVTDLCCHRR